MNICKEYIKNGLTLVPIPKGMKGPVKSGWNHIDDAVTTTEKAEKITGNVGLLHAYVKPCPTVALDIDDIELAKHWLEGRGISLSQLLNADDAVQIVSGKPCRAKLLYYLPEGTAPIETVQVQSNNESKCMILEFRCATRNGLSVQDVLPPSIHPDTNAPYQWGGKGDWRQTTRNLPSTPENLAAGNHPEESSKTTPRESDSFQ